MESQASSKQDPSIWKQHRHRFQESKIPQTVPFPTTRVDLLFGREDRSNLILCDPQSTATLLQRLCPTSVQTNTSIRTMLREGCCLKDNLFTNGKGAQSRRGSTSYTLGLWSNYGTHKGFTVQHRDNQRLADPLLSWLASFSLSHIRSLRPLLQPDLLCKLDAKAAAYYHLKHLLGKDSVLCVDEWWTSASFMEGFTSEAHQDGRDAQPSILVNCGACALLQLQLKKGGPCCTVWMNPGDVIFMDAGKLFHSVQKVSAWEELGGYRLPQGRRSRRQDMVDTQRWSIALFTRQWLVDKKTVTHPPIALEAPPQPSSTGRKRTVRKYPSSMVLPGQGSTETSMTPQH